MPNWTPKTRRLSRSWLHHFVGIREVAGGEILVIDSSVLSPQMGLGTSDWVPEMSTVLLSTCYGRVSHHSITVATRYEYGYMDACFIPGMSGGAVVNKCGRFNRY